MSGSAPTPKTVRRLGVVLTDKCDIALEGVCISAEKGPVLTFFVIEDAQQLHVCSKCLERLVSSGQWVDRQE
jgi:hypothetical protein